MRFSVSDVTTNDIVAMSTVDFQHKPNHDALQTEDLQDGPVTDSSWMPPPPPPPPPPPCPPPCPALSTSFNASSLTTAANSHGYLAPNGDVIAGSCSSSRFHQMAPLGGAFSSQNGVTSGALMTASPRQRLRRLQWSKLPANKVVGQTNVWTTSDRLFGAGTSDGPGYRLDFERMEQLFAVPQPPPMSTSSSTCSLSNTMTGTTSPSGSPVAGAKYPLSGGQTMVDGRTPSVPRLLRKQSEEINLLDSRRSLNVNVFLRQFRSLSHADLVLKIARGESEAFGAEKLRCLIRVLPPEDERQCLTSFTGDRTRLGNAEKFCLELMDIAQYEDRIEAMFLKEEFSQSVDRLKSSLDAFIHTASQLKTNSALHEVLYMVLIAGNFLNAGGHAGDAVGFRLSSLPSLVELRANKPRMTLLHYVAMEAEEKNPELLVFPEQLPRLKEAAECTVESIKVDVTSLSERLESVTTRIRHLDQDFQQAMYNFIKTARVELENMKSRLTDVDVLRTDLAVYYCEDETAFQLDDAFKIWDSFCEKFRRAVKENTERRVLEEKAEQRRRQMEERMKSLDECFQRRGSLDPSRDAPRDPNDVICDGGDLVDALFSGSTAGGSSTMLATSGGQRRGRIRSRSVTDSAAANHIPRRTGRDVINAGINHEQRTNEPSPTIATLSSNHHELAGNTNDVKKLVDSQTGSCSTSTQQQERSVSVSRGMRLTSSFDDGCCNRERVAIASVQEPSSVTAGSEHHLLTARLCGQQQTTTTTTESKGEGQNRTIADGMKLRDEAALDDLDRSTLELQMYVEKLQQLNVDSDFITKNDGMKEGSNRRTTTTTCSPTGKQVHQQQYRRTLPVKPGEVQTATGPSATVIGKTRASSASSTPDSQRLTSRNGVQSPQQQGQVMRSNRPEMARPNRSQQQTTPASPPVVMGDIANRRILPARPSTVSTRTPLVNSNSPKTPTVPQPRRSFGSSASYSAPVGGRSAPVVNSDRVRGTVTQSTNVTSPSASTSRRVAVTSEACAAAWNSSTSSSTVADNRTHQPATASTRRESLGKTPSSRQREVTSRLAQPKTPAPSSRRSSESGILDSQSPDQVAVRSTVRPMKSPTTSSVQPIRSMSLSKSETGSEHARRRSVEDTSRSTVSGSQPRSLETALAVAAAKRKDLRRQQEVKQNKMDRTSPSPALLTTSSDANVSSSADVGLSPGASASKVEVSADRRGKNGYMTLTTSAQAKSRHSEGTLTGSRLEDTNVDSRRITRDTSRDRVESRRASASRPAERNTSLVQSSNSSISGRRRGSNSSTTSSCTDTSRQSVEQLDVDSQIDNSSFRTADRSNRSTTFQTRASAAGRTRGPLARQGEGAVGATLAHNRGNSSTPTATNSVCNRLRCKPLPQQQQQQAASGTLLATNDAGRMNKPSSAN